MAQVFIVDDVTFPVHLRYGFAGTGAKSYECDFLVNETCSFSPPIERLLTGMCADVSRIRPGDDVIFYLQQSRLHEGMFFGSFKVVDEPFICSGSYLEGELGKKLVYRVKLRPGEVYRNGITERECLDSLTGISHPSQMCWSLIYRKLKGNRGCTMITDYEYNQIMGKIRAKNIEALDNRRGLSFDSEAAEIVYDDDRGGYNDSDDSDGDSGGYDDSDVFSIDVLPRLIYKALAGKAFEAHLQAYLSKNLERISPILMNEESEVRWIGNEVSCGVGMQSIDIMFVQEYNDEYHIGICELKDEQIEPYISAQIAKYIKWVSDFLVPTIRKRVVIHPIIVAPMPVGEKYGVVREVAEELNLVRIENAEVFPLKYVGFEVSEGGIEFQEFRYN